MNEILKNTENADPRLSFSNIPKFKDLKLIWFLLLIVLIAAILLYPRLNLTLHGGGDNCKYMTLAKSVYQGTGFTRIWSPEMDRDNQCSPGYVLLLTSVIAITGNTKPIIAFKILSALFFLLFIITISLLYIKHLKLNRLLVLCLALLFTLNKDIVSYASYVLTEIPFMLFMTLTLLILMNFEEKRTWKYLILTIVLSVFTIYIRIPAAFFSLAIFIWIITLKEFKKAFVFALFSLILLFPQIYRTVFVGNGYEHAFPTNSIIGNSINAIQVYLSGEFPQLLFPTSWPNHPVVSVFEIIISFLLLFIISIGLIGSMRDNKARLMSIVFLSLFLSYLPMNVIPVLRYLVVLTPFIFYFAVIGFKTIFKRIELRRSFQLGLSIIILILLTISFLPSYLAEIPFFSAAKGVWIDKGKPIDLIIPEFRDKRQTESHKALRFCKDHLPEDVILVSSRPHIGYFISERKCVNDQRMGLKTENADSIWAFFLDNKADYIVIENTRPYCNEHLMPAIVEYIDCFPPIFVSEVLNNIGVLKISRECLENNVSIPKNEITGKYLN